MKDKSFKTQAVILAGGQGSRLRPYTTIIPKPLMPLGDIPIIEIIICQLAKSNLRNITILTGYKSDLIEAYLGNGARWKVNIRYIKETKPMGTAGGLKLINNLADDFLVMNGDILANLNFAKLLDFHRRGKALATIAATERKVKVDFGVLEVNSKKELTDYIEKPQHRSLVSMGVNVFDKACLKYIKSNENIGMPEFFLRLKDADHKVQCFSHVGLWLDLGRLEDLESAQLTWQKNHRKFLPKN